MRLKYLMLLVVIIIAAPAFFLSRDNSYPIRNATPSGTTWIAFGDSLTFGTGASEQTSYPAVLARQLNVDIINSGVPGDTSRDGLKRIENDVLARDPRVVIVEFGGNDIFRRVKKKKTFENIETMIRRIQSKGALVVLVGFQFPFRSSYADAYQSLARRLGCVHVPNALGGIIGEPSLMADQIHPNAKGYGVMATKIEAAIRPVLFKKVGT